MRRRGTTAEELQAAKDEVTELEGDLETAEGEVTRLEGELESAEAQLPPTVDPDPAATAAAGTKAEAIGDEAGQSRRTTVVSVAVLLKMALQSKPLPTRSHVTPRARRSRLPTPR